MRVLVACEYSGVVRRAFRALGHHAYSCDLLPSDDNSVYHSQRNVLGILDDGWDLMIAHPPCTYLANSGNKHLYIGWKKENGPNPERWDLMREGAEFFRAMLNAPIDRIAVENPIMSGHAKTLIGRQQDQCVQPWMFGHGEIKATCLWLKNLPKLQPTNIVNGRVARVHKMPPSVDRWKLRSLTYEGIARAMAAQWSNL